METFYTILVFFHNFLHKCLIDLIFCGSFWRSNEGQKLTMKKIQKLRVSFAKFKVFSLFNMEEVEIIVEEKP